MLIREICDINGFDPPPSAAAAQQRLNIALTENVHTSVSDHRDYYTHSALYLHADHEGRHTFARWFWAGRRATALDLYDHNSGTAICKGLKCLQNY